MTSALRLPLAAALAGVLTLAPGLPARAAEPPPAEARAAFPYSALIPLGLASGYLIAGQPARAILATGVVYAAMVGGVIAGFFISLPTIRPCRPWTFTNLLFYPAYGGLIGLGASALVIAVDQARLPHPGGPWLAPVVSLGSAAALIYLGRDNLFAFLPGRDRETKVPDPPLSQ